MTKYLQASLRSRRFRYKLLVELHNVSIDMSEPIEIALAYSKIINGDQHTRITQHGMVLC